MESEEFALRSHLSAHPQDVAAAVRLGILMLRRGEYGAGWHYLYAGSKRYLPEANGQAPWLWRGECLQGKTLLVFPNEGLGDLLQFFPLTLRLAQQGARVIFQVPRVLHRLLAHSAAGAVQVLAWEDQPDGTAGFGADFYCSSSCLPGVMGLSVDQLPLAQRYLRAQAADVRRWGVRLGSADVIKVGIAWRGSPKHVRDALRSMPLAALQGLWDLPCQFYSLQVGTPSHSPQLQDETALIRDFADTAALVQCLDAVVTVDTSTAHLACGMGVPTFILLDTDNDWRWGCTGTQSPWYPSAYVLRQTQPGAWEALVQEAAQVLRARLGV